MSIETDVRALFRKFKTNSLVISSPLKRQTVRALTKKLDTMKSRLATKGNIYIYPRSWGGILDTNEEYFFSEYSKGNDELHALFRSSVHAEFLLMQQNNNITSKTLLDWTDSPVEHFRYRNRLVFSDGNKVSSWSNIVSLSNRGLNCSFSEPYVKHLYNANANNISDSMYAKGINPIKVENKVLQNGCGKFISTDRAYFFAKFTNNIGFTPNTNNIGMTPTDILKVQVDKTSRPLKCHGNKKHRQGYFFKMHGYPISDSELKSDSGSLYTLIVDNPLNIPI